MKPVKIYSNKFLFDAFTRVITRDEGAYNSDEVAEAIRIRKKGINIDNVASLSQVSEKDLKLLRGAVTMAEKIAETTDVVPPLCEL